MLHQDMLFPNRYNCSIIKCNRIINNLVIKKNVKRPVHTIKQINYDKLYTKVKV